MHKIAFLALTSCLLLPAFPPKAQAQRQPGLTEARMQELRDLFDLCDRNEDGKLGVYELINLLMLDGEYKKHSEEESKKIIESVDYNRNSSMEEHELLIYMAYTQPMGEPVQQRSSKKEQSLFNDFDTDKNGSIDLTELNAGMSEVDASLTDDDISFVFKENDFNKDGKLNEREFGFLMDTEAE